MATIVTRAGKGSALTWTEGDANITNLNTAKIEHVVEDTTPQLGGDLDVNGFKLTSTTNGNIVLEPNGTGDVFLSSDTVTVGDSNSPATLTTNGTGSLTLRSGLGSSASILVSGGVTITPYTGNKATVNNIAYTELVNAYGATTTVSLGTGGQTVGTVTLTSSSFTVNGFNAAGSSITLILTNNATITAVTQGTGTWKWAGGSKALSGVSNTVDILSVYYDGTTNYASINKGFV